MFPVTVDPSVYDVGQQRHHVRAVPVDNDYSGDTEIDAGTYDGGGNVAESFLEFSAWRRS